MSIRERIGSSISTALKDVQTANFKEAFSEIGSSIAGRNRMLFEMLTGRSARTNEEQIIPANPQGLYGHDHSGPPFGNAFMQPLLCIGGHRDTTNLEGDGKVFLFGGSANADTLEMDVELWVKPYPEIEDTPYSRGYIAYKIKTPSSCTVSIKIYRDTELILTHSISSSGGDEIDEITSSDGYFMPKAGRDFLSLQFISNVANCELREFSINQIATASH
jgi:hypothetical protein